MARICVIDDNDLMRDSVCRTLIASDHEADGFADPAAGARPTKTATSNETPIVNHSTLPSSRMRSTRGVYGGASARNR